MIRTPYRRRVPIDTPPVQEEVKSPRSVLEVEKKEEDPKEEKDSEEEEDPEEEEDLEEEKDPNEEPDPKEEVDSDLESTAQRKLNSGNGTNLDIAAIIAHQLQNIILKIVTQVTNNVNNANFNGGKGNGGNENGGNNGYSYKAFLAWKLRDFVGKGGAIALTQWIKKIESVIENSGCTDNQRVKYVAILFINKDLTWWNTQVQARGREAANRMTWEEFKALPVEEFCPSNEMEIMLQATQPTTIESTILTVGILTNEAVRCGTLSKGREKRKEVEESSKQGGWENDNKRAKVGKGFVESTPHRNQYAGSHPTCAECWAYHPEGGPCWGNMNQEYVMSVEAAIIFDILVLSCTDHLVKWETVKLLKEIKTQGAMGIKLEEGPSM
nr:reverse transcriptase domain-containing protein [Tanacetum cinerariifolium]